MDQQGKGLTVLSEDPGFDSWHGCWMARDHPQFLLQGIRCPLRPRPFGNRVCAHTMLNSAVLSRRGQRAGGA